MADPKAQVRLTFNASAAQVRTARLVCAAAVRRTDCSDEFVQAVRQAVGEACALALRAAPPRLRLHLELQEAPTAQAEYSLTIRLWPISSIEAAGDPLLRTVLHSLTDTAELTESKAGAILTLFWSASGHLN